MEKNRNSKIIVFAGTNEGRSLCEFLTGYEAVVTACVATEYGSLCLSDIPGLDIRQGRLSTPEIAALIKEYEYIVDATHPYATVVSGNVRTAAEELGKSYLRIIRPETEYGDVIRCESLEQASEILNSTRGKVLVTTGSKELKPYTGIEDYENRLFLRILPSRESLEACILHGFKTSNLICMQGPFTEEINAAMLRMLDAKYLVTKETGNSGGFKEKLDAATKCGVKVIVIGRPCQESGMSMAQACTYFSNRLPKIAVQCDCFPLFLKLKGHKIVVIGAGAIASRRIHTLLDFGGDITVIAPSLHDEIKQLGDRITILQREYRDQDLETAFLVLAATNRSEINRKVYENAKKRNIMVNIADNKSLSDFYFPALFSDDEICGAIISKNGENHRLVKEKAAIIRSHL